MRGPQRALGLVCFVTAFVAFAIFAAPGAPDSLLRAALPLTAIAAFIVAPVALLGWLGSRAAQAERARERRQAGAAWRAALAEASASAASGELAVSVPIGLSALVRPFEDVRHQGRGEDRTIERDDALAPSQAGAAPDGHRDRLEQAIAIEMARLAAARGRKPERARYLNVENISGHTPMRSTAILQH